MGGNISPRPENIFCKGNEFFHNDNVASGFPLLDL